MAGSIPVDSKNWLVGGGEMGAFLRSRLTQPIDRNASLPASDAISAGSQSLKTTLTILLNLGYPAFLVWGSDRILFYNDACLLLLRENRLQIPCGESIHQIWQEEWSQTRSSIEFVFKTGQPIQREREPFPPRQTRSANPVFNWSYSPLTDEAGNVDSVFATACPVSSTPNSRPSEASALQLNHPSEQRLRLLADSLPVFISYADADQRYQFVNKAYETWFGLSQEEICGQLTRDIIGEANYQRVQGYIERVLQGEQVSYDLTVPDREKGDRDLSVMLVPDIDPQSQVRGYYAVIVDTSSYKQLEQELLRSRDFRELIFNEAGDALFLVDSDTLLTIDCNRQAVELFEAASKEALIHIEGHTLQKRQFTPTELEVIRQEIREKGFWSLEIEYVTHGGREFWGDLSVKQLTFGDQRFNLVRVTDISQRKATELALQQSEARYLSILEDQTELITRFTPNGTLLFVNDAYCRYFDLSKEEVAGFNYKPLIHPEDQPEIERCLAALSLECPVGTVENRVFTQGAIRWTQWTNRAIYDDQGNLVELQSVGRDIDDRKRVELQVQAALAEKEVLLEEVYHRVKNNLQLIQSMLQMKQRRLKNPEAVQALQHSWSRVMTISLVHEVLYQSGNLAQINLEGYVPTLVQHLATSYRSSTSATVVEVNVQPIIIPMKKAICCGLILNELVTNALKYAFPDGRKGTVVVEILADRAQPKGTITMMVRDDGVGLPQPVHFADVKTLGLVLVQDFVDQLRGSLEVELGQGSLFRITFTI